jgi:hypothetical protein
MLQFFKACGRAEAMAAARRVQVAGVGKTRTEELRKKRDKEQRRTITTEVRLLGEGDGGERGDAKVFAPHSRAYAHGSKLPSELGRH